MKSELEQYVIDKLEQLRQKQDISYYMLAKRGGLSLQLCDEYDEERDHTHYLYD